MHNNSLSARSVCAGFFDPAPRVHVRPGHFFVTRGTHTVHALLSDAVAVCLADRYHRVCGIAVVAAHEPIRLGGQPSAAASGTCDVIRWLLNSMIESGAELPWIGATLVSGNHLSADGALPITATCSQVLATLYELGITLTRADIGQHGKPHLSWHMPLAEPELTTLAAITIARESPSTPEMQRKPGGHKRGASRVGLLRATSKGQNTTSLAIAEHDPELV